MSRNVNSFFSKNPATLDISRSKFDRPQTVTLSMNAGELIPFYVDEVLPGDSMSVDTSKVVRMSTLIAPIFGNIWMDTYYFFCPSRLVWSHWKNFMGESDQAWLPSASYTVPQLTSPSGGWNVGTIADYMGIPTGVSNLSVNALPFRIYSMICSEWFRDENLTDPLYWSTGDATVAGTNGTNYINDCYKGGMPFKVSKYFDYFTGCLPAPQKGPDILLPIGQQAPVYAAGAVDNSALARSAMYFKHTDGTSLPTGYHDLVLYTTSTGAGGTNMDNASYSISGTTLDGVTPINLMADLTRATGSSINQLRTAFQVQKLYEKDARGGSRYIEQIKAHFGVSSPDARLQRPEYLGGTRIPINIHQVVQNSATDTTSPQGHTTAYSLTIDTHSDFTKSFTEHGFVIGLCCIRYEHLYQQGIERFWSRTLREDFYYPVFANIGEQGVKLKEIYATGTSADNNIFGYQEAWAEYRYKPSRVAGEMRSQYSASLDLWHLGDYYTTAPSLSDSWIREDKSVIDRCLAVTSAVSNQFIADIYIKNSSVRPMPLYSIPGLIDHH